MAQPGATASTGAHPGGAASSGSNTYTGYEGNINLTSSKHSAMIASPTSAGPSVGTIRPTTVGQLGNPAHNSTTASTTAKSGLGSGFKVGPRMRTYMK